MDVGLGRGVAVFYLVIMKHLFFTGVSSRVAREGVYYICGSEVLM